jgi:hypothetical protein
MQLGELAITVAELIAHRPERLGPAATDFGDLELESADGLDTDPMLCARGRVDDGLTALIDVAGNKYDVTFAVDAVGGLSRLVHRTAVERLAHAGAVPNTSLAIVTELFRDWKSPVASKAREIIKAYQADLLKLQLAA